MPYFKHNGLSFYYTEIGEGTPFIFQHGLGGSVDQIEKIYSPPAGIRLITFDFCGHGKTPMGRKEQLNFRSFADDTLALMHHLQLEAAIVGGISMGAAVALNFAIRYPTRILGLILSRPAWLDGPMVNHNNRMFKSIARLIQEHGPAEGRQLFMASDLYNQLSKLSPSTAQSFLVNFSYEKASETTEKFVYLPDDSPSNSRDEWKRITTPTLVLANQSDPVHPFEYGLEYASGIIRGEFREITSKAISEDQHNKDVQKNIDKFISNLQSELHET